VATGIDPDAVRQLAADKQRLEDEKHIKDGKFQEVLDIRLKAAQLRFLTVGSYYGPGRDA